jgi:hypothetical protein
VLPRLSSCAIVDSTQPVAGGEMPIGILTGRSIKMAMLPADHTYVTSSVGHVWPCFGRSAGGLAICSGAGNVERADCLSNPRAEAGIVYGVTGVCHQTANRILYPAGKTVSAARGYDWNLSLVMDTSIHKDGVYLNERS